MRQKTGGKLLGILLSLALMLWLMAGMSMTALAAGTESTPITISSWTELKDELSGTGKPGGESESNPTYYKLENDVKDPEPSATSYIEVASGRRVVLDLNGMTINRGLTAAVSSGAGYVIKVDGDMTIKDSVGTGKITGGTKHYTNVRSVTVNKKKIILKAGRSCIIKANLNKLYKGRKLMPRIHTAALRYVSTSPGVAKVTKRGRIKGLKKGKCCVYVIAHNGVSKKTDVIIK